MENKNMPYGRALCGDLMETSFFSLVLEYENIFLLFEVFFLFLWLVIFMTGGFIYLN